MAFYSCQTVFSYARLKNDHGLHSIKVINLNLRFRFSGLFRWHCGYTNLRTYSLT